ncbi:hypothetical protein N7462_008167 [Penicillium macrosclerotiorum]|uniref:uncharacterized protein n=1 Tax=Penicillium macrosclerotiorum TaxID=303699 RepID=UPI00254931D4|nr:uncharacterized protein N7462_008167 [Penicillium macrosclerotiorum]KAJ5679923.1 hypothetical protein N7462_008167 [Penicillium macrosclerotiorum]
MRLHPWSTVYLVGAIAGSIPFATSHELHLPYLPAIQPNVQSDTESDSCLSLKWSIINGSLFANDDQVFPPSMPMQLHAPRLTDGVAVAGEDVELVFALEARPLSSDEVGPTSSIVRVRVDLMDAQGTPVTPNAVVLDLLAHPDGSQRITRIRMEPGPGRHHHGGANRPWHMKFWQTQMSAFLKHTQHDSGHQKNSPHSSASGSAAAGAPAHPKSAAPDDSSSAESQVGFAFSPYWSPPTYSHRGGHHSSHHRDRPFLRLVRPVILPAVLGAVAGLVACLVGFVIGHLCMSLSVRLGLRKRKQPRRFRSASVEDGSQSEKAQLLVPEIYVTDTNSEA